MMKVLQAQAIGKQITGEYSGAQLRKLYQAKKAKVGDLIFSDYCYIGGLENNTDEDFDGIFGAFHLSDYIIFIDNKSKNMKILSDLKINEKDYTKISMHSINGVPFIKIVINGFESIAIIDSASKNDLISFYTAQNILNKDGDVAKTNQETLEDGPIDFGHSLSISFPEANKSIKYVVSKTVLDSDIDRAFSSTEHMEINALLGIPFFRSFEHIVIDYKHHELLLSK